MGEHVRVRDAGPDDVSAVRTFGATHVPPHYAPLIGPQAARAQVSTWWTDEHLHLAASAGRLVVAEAGGRVVGVAQRGWDGTDHVLYKLYVDPDHRGEGLGPRLIEAIERQLPPDAARLCVEHFAGNARAGAFYEREGFTVERTVPSADGDRALDVVWRARSRS